MSVRRSVPTGFVVTLPEGGHFLGNAGAAQWLSELAVAEVQRMWNASEAIPRELHAICSALRAASATAEVAPVTPDGSVASPGAAMPVQWLTTAEAAEQLGCKEPNVRKLCRLGHLDARKKEGNAWQVSAASVRARVMAR